MIQSQSEHLKESAKKKKLLQEVTIVEIHSKYITLFEDD